MIKIIFLSIFITITLIISVFAVVYSTSNTTSSEPELTLSATFAEYTFETEAELSAETISESETTTEEITETTTEQPSVPETTSEQTSETMTESPTDAETTTEQVAESETTVTYTDWVANLSISASYSQIITVAASGNTATISMHIKDSDGNWNEILSTSGYIGKYGLGKTQEGDLKTPVGIYSFTTAFGIKSNPGTSFSYTQVDDSYYWVDDSLSAYYNQFVSTNIITADWSSAEHILSVGSAYNYVLAINYNSSCTPYAGSGIFLHCSTGNATAGCVSVPEFYMIQILQNISTDCIIIIDSTTNIYNY